MQVSTRELRIETSTACSYRCLMCPRESLTRPIEIMSNDLFTRIVEMAKTDIPGLELCTVSGFGEMGADPHWSSKLSVARQSFDEVHVVTTLASFTLEDVDLLAKLATEVRVSVYATNDETYRQVHRPPSRAVFEQIEQRIRRLSDLRGPNLHVTLTCCELEENRDQIEEWIDRWRDRVDEIEVWAPHNWVVGRAYRRVSGPKLATCGRPAHGPIQVQVDGTVTVCCFDHDGVMVVGDLRRQSFAEVLQGDELARIRSLHAAGRADELPLCAVCDQREPPDVRAGYLRFSSTSDAADRVLRTSSGREAIPLRSAADGLLAGEGRRRPR